MSRDSELGFDVLHKRDRRIGLELPEETEPEKQLENWLSKLVTEEDKVLWRQVESGHRLISFAMVVLGLLVGWLTISGLLQYDGQGRVNLVHLLVVFVGLQLILASLTVVAMLPVSVTRWFPGFSSFQQMLKWFSPGHLQKFLSRFMPKSEQLEIGLLLGRNKKLFADIGKWQIFSWSQLFAVTFNSAALITLFVLIAIKDIAFGWSSTLDIQPDAILQVTNFLSIPWQSWLSGEIPSRSLVEASHYFRLQEELPSEVNPALLGQWWPFLMLCLLFYGLLPRFLLILFCRYKLRSAIARITRYFPGRQELLERLNSAVIETQASRMGETEQEEVEAVTPIVRDKIGGIGASPVLINWSGFELTDRRFVEAVQQAGRFSIQASYQAGTHCRLEEDAEVIQSIAKSASKEPIGILVKSWEPPLGELADFIEDLRLAISPERGIRLLPVAMDSGKLIPLDQRDLEEWKRFVKRLVDPWVCVAVISPRNNDE